MTWDVLFFDEEAASLPGREVYLSVKAGNASPAGTSPRVAEFSARVMREVPELRGILHEDASAHLHGNYFLVCLPEDFDQPLLDRLQLSARRCRLASYDPQLDVGPDGRPRLGLSVFPWL